MTQQNRERTPLASRGVADDRGSGWRTWTGANDNAQRLTPAVRWSACGAPTRGGGDVPSLVRRVRLVREVLRATVRPAGLLALFEALARVPPVADRVLARALVPIVLRLNLRGQAPGIVAHVDDARRALQSPGSSGGSAVHTALVDALVHRREVLSGERLRLLRLNDTVQALDTHATQLCVELRGLDEKLSRTGQRSDDPLDKRAVELVRALAPLVLERSEKVRLRGLGGLAEPRDALTDGLVSSSALRSAGACSSAEAARREAWGDALVPVVVALLSLSARRRDPASLDALRARLLRLGKSHDAARLRLLLDQLACTLALEGRRDDVIGPLLAPGSLRALEVRAHAVGRALAARFDVAEEAHAVLAWALVLARSTRECAVGVPSGAALEALAEQTAQQARRMLSRALLAQRVAPRAP